jgi:DNA-binding CsgD family transcriptional regulator
MARLVPIRQPSHEIRLAQEALEGGQLERARAGFESALAREESAEAFEGLAAAAWLLADSNAMLPALEAAYRLYSAAGEPRGAARVATRLGVQHLAARGEPAVSSGWLQRAKRHLEGIGDVPERAWLAVWEAHLALLFRDDAEDARRLIGEARSIASRLGLGDVELLSLGLEGVELVSRCDVSEGMRRLDEVTAAAVGGDLADVDAAGNASCYMLTACERVRDFDRAAQWFEKVRAFIDRARHMPGMTFCRDHWVGILIWRGAWKEAETETLAMLREAETFAPRFASVGHARLATLRYRQGRWEEAEELLSRVERTAAVASLGRAAIALDGGEASAAIEHAERYLRHLAPDDRLDRAPALEILARAHALRGSIEEARAAVTLLREIAESVGTEGLRASASAAEGAVALRRGDPAAARRSLEDATDHYERSGGGAFENARVRLDLAAALRAEGREPEARRQAERALARAMELGAAREADGARSFLESAERFKAGAADAPEDRLAAAVPSLSPREVEVLRLIAAGLSNAAIAEKLFLSEHTVKRHVANILGKLDLPSRSAAAAHAARLDA